MVYSINNILFVVVIKYMARTNDSKIDHVKAYNISLSYCTVHIVRWNIMWNVYFFLMASRTLTVSDFQAECLLNKVAVSYACIYCYQHIYIHICSF